MNWITVDRLHINADQVEGFHWIEGRLIIRYTGSDGLTTFRDPERKKYLRLCEQLGVEPVEDDGNGQN